jgi:hypothetical protein
MQGFFGPSDEWLLMRTNLPGFLRGDIYAVRLGQESRATPLLAEEFGERSPALSPDGSWLAYTSNETGDYEVYLRPFPDVDSRRWQISTGGGVQPVWSKDGRELFYIDPDRRMVAARVQASGGFDVEDRTVLFQVPEQMVGADLPQSGKYDVSPDGRRFIMARAVADVDSASFSDDWILVNGFLEELVRAVAN